MEKRSAFIEAVDNRGLQYLSFENASVDAQSISLLDTRWFGHDDIATFLSLTMTISHQATGVFSEDLTSRDDLILAILSLALVLVIQVILTTILLQSEDSNISNFGFSIKQFVDLAREFRLRHLIRGPREHISDPPFTINYKAPMVSISVLLCSSGMEVALLFFSSPSTVHVSNATKSVRLNGAVSPNWNDVRGLRTAAINPCTAITFIGVEQELNLVSACLTSNLSTMSFESFKGVNTEVEFTITSVAMHMVPNIM